MKSIYKVILVVILFTFAAFAEDGNLGNGSKTCTTSGCFSAPTTPETNPTEGGSTSDETTSGDTILATVQGYWDSVVQYFEN